MAIDAVSTAKAERLPRDLAGLDLLFLNEAEGRAITGRRGGSLFDVARALRERGAGSVILTRGGSGIVLVTASEKSEIAVPRATPVDVTGAGDAMIAGTLFGLVSGAELADAVRTGSRVAKLTIVESPTTVSRHADAGGDRLMAEGVPIEIAPRIAAELARGGAVVALETTIVAHGMPYPQNVETALEVEALVRENGAEPATIAIAGGRIRIGLEPAGIRELAGAPNVRKVSRADLPFTVATGATGATTVAATMIAAALAGIAVFATGGIGGVHRGAEGHLGRLGRSRRARAHAGRGRLCGRESAARSAQNARGAGNARRAGHLLPHRHVSRVLESQQRTARAAAARYRGRDRRRHSRMQRALGYTSGTLIANPVDAADEIPAGEIAAHIDAAGAAALVTGIKGKDVTPFLLDRLLDLTGGRSLTTNIALIKNTARLASAIAVELAAGGFGHFQRNPAPHGRA